MTTLRLMVLGGFALTSGDGANIELPTRKDRLLLSYLCLNPGRPQPREKLYGLLWADRGETQARGSLRQSLAALREALRSAGPDALASDRDSVTFNLSGIVIDAFDFERLAADAATLDQAVIQYRGELLAGIEPPTPEFEQWLKPERQRLEDLAAKAVEQVAASEFSQAAVKHALDLGRQLISRDRLREPIYRALMRLLVRQRERAEALKVFAGCRDALKEELGISPELETEQLYRDILTDRPDSPMSLATAPLPEGPAERPSLAVMPFANIAGEPGLNPLCDGLTEDIITGLGRFKLLFVIDRNSSSAVSQLTSDTSEFAKRLGVSLLVQGSLQRQAELVRITVRLVKPSSRAQIWANTFDCAATDVLGVPDKVTNAIVAMLHSRVESSLIEQSRRKPALAAYECVLRGVKHMRGYGPDDNRQALELFQQAISLDPEYALARAYRAFIDVVLHEYDHTPKDILARSRAMAEEAVELDPDEARCHWLLGMILGYSGEATAEVQHYLRALALNPNDANVIASYGMALAALGRPEEGIDRIREAMRLNPYHPEWYWVVLGDALYIARRYDDALEALRQKTSPRIWVLARLAACCGQLGRMEEAAKLIAEILLRKPDFTFSQQRGSAWSLLDTAHFNEGMRKAGLPS